MKVLIVGGAGYVGSALVPTLNHDTTVIDNLWFENNLPSHIKVIQKDVMKITKEDLIGFEVVVFIAGLSNDPMAEFSPAMNFVENAAGPAYLAFIAKSAGVKRFIYGGSCSVYGYTEDKLFDETSPTLSSYPYGLSKLQGEYGVLQVADDSFSVICFRKGTVCGYSPRMRLDLVLNTMFKTALETGIINVNNSSICRPILSINDAVIAYTRAIEIEGNISGIFNIASGNYTVGELAVFMQQGLKKLMNVDTKIVEHHIKDFRNYKVSFDKAKQVLGFSAKYNVPDIIQDLVENYSKFKDFDNKNYYNIKVFKELL